MNQDDFFENETLGTAFLFIPMDLDHETAEQKMGCETFREELEKGDAWKLKDDKDSNRYIYRYITDKMDLGNKADCLYLHYCLADEAARKRGIWMAVFHSISAFCNAGFDILGTESNRYPSLTGYADSPVINITIMLLIVIGGIGFLTWDDIFENKWRFHRYRMQSKVILVTTGFLIFLPAMFFFFSDFSALPAGKRLLASFFQSVTPRTAGFNTVSLSAMSGASQGVMILLMLIGGSPGSTAGGMKTTTLAVLIANATATFRQRDSAQFFGRRVDCSAVKTAATILTMYLVLFFGGAVFISAYEHLPLSACLYETASAVGTVGLTLGITPQLRIPSQMVLILLMYLGRVGGLTLIYAALSSKKVGNARLPQEKITIG